MKISKRTIYNCEFCSKHCHRRPDAERHEKHCIKRDDREPFLGELSIAYLQGVFEDDIKSGAIEAPPLWWPGKAGMIYGREGWVEVEGYKPEDVREYEEEAWPRLDGEPLIDVRPWARRLCYIDEEEWEHWSGYQDPVP